ncbi:unnamed protein product, partial [Hapterophycus canaliculatus]
MSCRYHPQSERGSGGHIVCVCCLMPICVARGGARTQHGGVPAPCTFAVQIIFPAQCLFLQWYGTVRICFSGSPAEEPAGPLIVHVFPGEKAFTSLLLYTVLQALMEKERK